MFLKHRIALALLLVFALGAALPADENVYEPKPDPDHEKRVEWWQDARFGFFLCWSLGAQRGLGDDGWNILWNNISWEEYEGLVNEFNPVDFDPRRIAKQIKSSGAKYVVFTVKHHAGFCMWDSKLTDFDMASTPYGKDVLKMLLPALREEGLRVGIYYSVWDWHRPEFHGGPKETHMSKVGRTLEDGNELWPKFLEFYLGQLEELLTEYGKLDVLWFDGGRVIPNKVIELVRSHQPHLVVSNRFCNGHPLGGDFVVCENQVPESPPGRPWETCLRGNGGWFYTKTAYWPARDVALILAECASKNGNLLYDFPINPKGTFDEEAVVRMKEIGDWLAVHGESIYGCEGTPLLETPWGYATSRPGHLYLHLHHKLYTPGEPIVLKILKNNIQSARMIGSDVKLTAESKGDDVVVKLPDDFTHGDMPSVIDLEVNGPLELKWTVLQSHYSRWDGAKRILEAEDAEYLNGTTLLEGDTRFSKMNGVRMHAGNPPESGGLKLAFELDCDMEEAYLLVVAGSQNDSTLAVSIDGGELKQVEMPTTGYHYKGTFRILKLGKLSKGKHEIHAYLAEKVGLPVYIDAFLVAEGTPVDGNFYVKND